MKRYPLNLDDTAYAANVMADAVQSEIENCFGAIPNGREISDAVADTARKVYSRNPGGWGRKLGRKGGRDFLTAFMRHWMSSELAKRAPSIFRKLPSEFKMGHPLRCG